ncbi:MAG: RHS repeat domain-containing protein [Bacteroidales bacterium]
MLHYTYTANGQKISQQLEDDGRLGTRREYAGPFVYVNSALGWVNTTYGRIVALPRGGFHKELHLSDHLGNTRMVLEEIDSKYEVAQEAAYYPFGLAIPTQSFALPNENDTYQNRYLYNGKEYQDDFELNWYDYGARFYDPQIARWHSVDPLSELYYSWSPYNYILNNPIKFIDPNGMWVETAEGYTTDDPDEIKAYMDFMRSQHQKQSNNNKRENRGKKIDFSEIKDKAKENPWGAAGAAHAAGYSLDAGQVGALYDGRDIATDADYDSADRAFMLGVSTIVLLPGGGGALVGRAVIKGGKVVFRNAPRAYNSVAAAINSLKDIGMHGYVLLESSVAAQGFAGIAQGLGEYYFQLPPGSVDHPFVITHISSETTKSFLFFLLNEQ